MSGSTGKSLKNTQSTIRGRRLLPPVPKLPPIPDSVLRPVPGRSLLPPVGGHSLLNKSPESTQSPVQLPDSNRSKLISSAELNNLLKKSRESTESPVQLPDSIRSKQISSAELNNLLKLISSAELNNMLKKPRESTQSPVQLPDSIRSKLTSSAELNNLLKKSRESTQSPVQLPDSIRSKLISSAELNNLLKRSRESTQPLVGVVITELYHRGHESHNLKWLESSQTHYKCSGCKEPGYGPRYGCPEASCDFNLHWDCTFTTLDASHHFYDQCQFKFFDRPQESSTNARFCNACLRDIRGFVYHCEKGRRYHQCCDTGKDLHPTCRNLPPVREVKVDGEAVIFCLASRMKEKCALCGEKYLLGDQTGWSYVSACKTYHVHVACAARLWNQRAVQRMRSETSLPLVVRINRGSSSKYWKIIKFATRLIVALLSGNPASVACTLFETLFENL